MSIDSKISQRFKIDGFVMKNFWSAEIIFFNSMIYFRISLLNKFFAWKYFRCSCLQQLRLTWCITIDFSLNLGLSPLFRLQIDFNFYVIFGHFNDFFHWISTKIANLSQYPQAILMFCCANKNTSLKKIMSIAIHCCFRQSHLT